MAAVGVDFKVGAIMSNSVVASFGTLKARVKGLSADLRGLEKQSKSAERLASARAKLEKMRAEHAQKNTEASRTALRAAVRGYGSAYRAAKEYGITIKNAAIAQDKLAASVERTRTALARQRQLQRNVDKRTELQGEILGTVGTAMTVGVPITLALQYETNFADLKKVASFTSPEQEKAVQKEIFDVARYSGISASGMTSIAAAAAESGVVNDAQGNLDSEKLKRFLKDAAEMSVAYGITAEEAGERLAIFQSRMGLTSEETKAMGDAMNYMASKTNASASKTSEVVSRMGAVGKMAGLSAKSIAGLAGAMVASSESPEVAGTAMKNFLTTLAQGEAMSNTQKAAFERIGITNVLGIAEGMKKGGKEAEDTIITVLEALKTLPEAEQTGIAKDMFGLESLASFAPYINDANKLRTFFALANSEQAVGSQGKEFATRSATTQGALDRLKTSAGVLGITVGSVLLPAIADGADMLTTMLGPITELAENYPTVTKVVLGAMAAMVGFKVATMVGAYATTIISDAVTVGKNVFDFFRISTLKSNTALVTERISTLYAAASKKVLAIRTALATKMSHFFRRATLKSTAELIRKRAVTIATSVATNTMARGTKIATAAQWLFNAAMKANPIGLAIAGVGALVAGMVWLYKTCEPVRAVFDAVFTYIGDKLSKLGSIFKTVGSWFGLIDETPSDSSVSVSGFSSVEQKSSAPSLERTTASPSSDIDSVIANANGASSSNSIFSSSESSVPVTFSIAVNGITDADFGKRVVTALEQRRSDLERLITGIVNEQRRLSYE